MGRHGKGETRSLLAAVPSTPPLVANIAGRSWDQGDQGLPNEPSLTQTNERQNIWVDAMGNRQAAKFRVRKEGASTGKITARMGGTLGNPVFEERDAPVARLRPPVRARFGDGCGSALGAQQMHIARLCRPEGLVS